MIYYLINKLLISIKNVLLCYILYIIINFNIHYNFIIYYSIDCQLHLHLTFKI